MDKADVDFALYLYYCLLRILYAGKTVFFACFESFWTGISAKRMLLDWLIPPLTFNPKIKAEFVFFVALISTLNTSLLLKIVKKPYYNAYRKNRKKITNNINVIYVKK